MNPPVQSILPSETSTRSENSMEHHTLCCESLPALVHISCFRGQSGVDEVYLMIRPKRYASIDIQLEWVFQAYQYALHFLKLSPDTAIFRRFFASDLMNQTAAFKAHPFSNPNNPDVPCAISWIGQPPAFPAKTALWAYHVSDPHRKPEMILEGKYMIMRKGKISHHWSTGLSSISSEDSYRQTKSIFNEYLTYLQAHDMTLDENVMRTWLFVRDIDANYPGMIAARREIFEDHGLTPDTHFIASTGIEGTHSDAEIKVTMDAYAISGIRKEQIRFLEATDYLSPTHIYGVTFERGTQISWKDRKHVMISGTASIDGNGQIVHTGNVLRQLDRVIENINALLNNANTSLEDMSGFIVYVRDTNDAGIIGRRMREIFDNTPIIVLTAPVCRPGWLVELEGSAIVSESHPCLPSF